MERHRGSTGAVSSCRTPSLHPAHANSGRSAQGDAAFSSADANTDGNLSSNEYLAAAEKEFRQQSAASNPDAVPIYFIWVPDAAAAAPVTTASNDRATTRSGDLAMGPNQAAAHAAMAFDNQDGDGDGAVSKSEWQTGTAVISPDLVELHFKLLDANGDNAVTKDEYGAKWTDRFNQAQQAQGSAGQGESVPVWVLYVY